MKTCSRCKETKPRDEFYNNTRYVDGKQSYCKPCCLAVGRESAARNPEKRRAKNRAWHLANPDKRRVLTVRSRLRKYGLTPEDYSRLLAKQGGKCAICRASSPGWRKGRAEQDEMSWHIDHDHSCCPHRGSCGKCVRALLCNRCNIVLGQSDEDPSLLAAMIEYLAKQGQALRIVGSNNQ